MRLLILAVGHARASHEGRLAEDYVERAQQMGRRLGIADVAVEEVAVSKARDADAAQVILLDAKGKGMTSEDFAEAIAALRDAGNRHLVFVIGGPDGLAPLPRIKPGRSLAFGPQTWPHLLVRAMLAEQLYRALTILAGHPYHRGS